MMQTYNQEGAEINMPRPRSKEELITAASTNYEKLLAMIENRTDAEKENDYDFSADEKKKRHTGDVIRI